MKQNLYTPALILVTILLSVPIISTAQTAAPKFVSILYVKSKSAEFLATEKELWAPVHKQFISEGKKIAWYLYRVKYPRGTKAEYDYVRFNIFSDWKQAEAPYAGLENVVKKVHPNLTAEELSKKTDQEREIVWEQLHQVIDEAVITKKPAQYIIVNEVKTVPGSESDYVKMEVKYFKPFHAERASRGLMNNWSLYKLFQPYGDKFDHDYVTLNGFNNWDDITKNPPSSVWEKVHGNLNFNQIHSQILAKRITVNNELWELVAYATE
jgi:hypothetical protein